MAHERVDRELPDRHGRRARTRGASDPRRRPLHPGAAGRRAPLPDPHEQLAVHAARPRRAAADERTAGAGERRSGRQRSRRPASCDEQRPGGTAYVIGEAGLTTALHEMGYVLAERDPDYVVLGETRSYSFERITRGIRLIADGARFIAANPDVTGPEPGRDPARDRLGRGAHLEGDRRRAVLRRQAEPADDARGAARDRSALRVDRDDRRPHGHRRRGRDRGRTPHDPRPDRHHARARWRSASRTARRRSSTRSPI